MILFNQKIFGEIVYVVHTIWNKKYLNFRESKKNVGNILPRFNCFFGFQGFESQKESIDTNCLENEEIVEKSEEGIEELAQELFDSKKLKLLNFKDVKGQHQEEEVIREKFEEFVKKVSKAVYLSAEGVYEEEGPSVLSFSEQEEEDAFDGMKKLARAHSQLYEDDDEFVVSSGSKRLKRF